MLIRTVLKSRRLKSHSLLNGISGTAVDLLEDLGELADDVGSVLIEDWSITSNRPEQGGSR